MEKLFDDTFLVQKERPTSITKQQKDQFYSTLAKECIKQNFSNDKEDLILEDLKELSMLSNGFEKAKYLEKYGNADYEFNPEFISWLDDIFLEWINVLNENVRVWVNAHKPKRALEKGSKFKVTKDLDFSVKEGNVYYVVGLIEDRACYVINSQKNMHGGYVIAWERLEANCELLN